MITTTSLLHPSMQIKIRSARVQAEFLGLVAPILNSKRTACIVAVKHEGQDKASFYLVDNEGWIGTDITEIVLKACPYPTPVVKKPFFKKTVDKVATKVASVCENVQIKAAGYLASALIITASFS